MKIICLKNYLKEAVNLCEKITGKNLSLPILNNILISTNERNIKIIATNLELGIEIEIPAKIEKKGKVAVPAGIINNFLSNFSGDENIKLEEQNNNLLISTKNTSTIIKGQSPEDFPIIPRVKSENQNLTPVKDFISGLKSVLYSASISNIKPEISSIFIYSGKNIPLTFVATDSFRLAEKKFNYPLPEFNKLLMPLRTATEALRIFDGKEGKIKLSSDKNQINMELENIRFISRITEGVFPDYQQIIPKKFATDVIIDKDGLTGALRAASIFSGKLNEINVAIDANKNLITIKTLSQDVGEYVTNLSAKITGEDIKMSFNHKYVADCLGHIPPGDVLMRFTGEGKPLLVTGTNDNSFQYLIMPMNTV